MTTLGGSKRTAVGARVLIRFLGVLGFALFCVDGFAKDIKPEDVNVRDPRLKEGQMFVVRLVPAGKRLEVFVTGREAARLEFDQLGFNATLFVGDKALSLTPERAKDRFVIDAPPASKGKASKLRIELKEGEKTEKFEFDRLP